MGGPLIRGSIRSGAGRAWVNVKVEDEVEDGMMASGTDDCGYGEIPSLILYNPKIPKLCNQHSPMHPRVVLVM
jgi:hypothetical protein